MAVCGSALKPRKSRGEPGHSHENGSACRFIAATVASVLGADAGDVIGPMRGCASTAFARGAAMYLAHVTLAMTFSEVGRHFGRDRTTVAHACARIEDARENEKVDQLIGRLEDLLEGWRRIVLVAQR